MLRFNVSSLLLALPLVAAATPALGAEVAAKPADWSDSLKKIGLNDDGSAWVSFGGEVRERYEYWNNFGTGRTEGGFLLTRVLANADFHLNDTVRVFVEGKSAFATDRDSLPGGVRTLDVDELDLQQGFVELTLPKSENLEASLKAGRLGLNFGKQRLVSTLPWSNTMRAWDGVDATLKTGGWQADVFFTQFAPVRKHDFNNSDRQSLFYGVYATGPVSGEDLKADVYYLGKDQSDTTNSWNGSMGHEERHTIGSRLFGKNKDSQLDYDLEGAYQFGRLGTADINAYMIATEIGWSANDAARTRLFATADYASGDRSAKGDVNTFSQLYPLAHAFHGQADLLGRQNLISASIGAAVSPLGNLTLKGEVLKFWRADNGDAIYNAGGGVGTGPAALATSRDVGTEIDLKATYKVDAHLTLELGYGHLFAGQGYATGNRNLGNDVDFAYGQAGFKF